MFKKSIPQKEVADKSIKDILLKEGLITEDIVAQAEKFKTNHSISYVDYFISEGIITKNAVGEAVGKHLGLQYVDLKKNKPGRALVAKIPDQIAKEYRIVVFMDNDQGLFVASDEPKKKGLVGQIEGLFPERDISIYYALPQDIDDVLVYYNTSFASRFSDVIKNQEHVAPEVVDELINDALDHRASDLHLEPQEGDQDAVLRMRIDGVLQDAGNIPAAYFEFILNRIKVQSQLHIEDSFAVQDGALRHRYKESNVDIRVSIVPTVNGEAINLHFLTDNQTAHEIDNLGLSDEDKEVLINATKKSYGMIIVTGPTGAGKTTTLYSLLKLVNKPEVHIMTIEDPVEYKVLGINQIQVDTGKNLTFGEGLRSILRQDPNVILVGEVRDEETAHIAINASLTGHLLLTTFHAVDTSATIPRLIEMGIEPFLLASTLEVVVSQRLVRRLCDECKQPVERNRDELKDTVPGIEKYFSEEKIEVFEGKGCDVCNMTGYKGRLAVFEILPMTKEMQTLILSKPPISEIWDVAKKQRSHTLFEDGIEKVKQGLTTFDELLRVVPMRSEGEQEV